jgi:hypothetical protein
MYRWVEVVVVVGRKEWGRVRRCEGVGDTSK